MAVGDHAAACTAGGCAGSCRRRGIASGSTAVASMLRPSAASLPGAVTIIARRLAAKKTQGGDQCWHRLRCQLRWMM